MAPNAHQTILTDSVKPGDLDIASLFNVIGRVAVVTGGGTGLGLVTAQALAQNGCKVYITGRRLEVLEKAAEFKPSKGDGRIIAIQADLNSKEAILELRKKIEAEEKYINLLVNNHGVYLSDVPLSKVPQTAQGLSEAALENETFESWNETYSINVTSVHFTTFAFLPLLAAAATVGGAPEPGSVINVTSISGLTHTAQGGQFSYNSSKAAVAHITTMMASEFSRRGLGIRVNAIAPGYFPSGMSTSDFMQHGFGQADHWIDKYGIPLRRVGNAIDYAQLVLGLFANKYITGDIITIDGGWLLKQDPAPCPSDSTPTFLRRTYRFTAAEEAVWNEVHAKIIKDHMLKAIKDDGRLSDRAHSTLRDKVKAMVKQIENGGGAKRPAAAGSSSADE